MVKYTIDQVIDAGIRAYAKYGESFRMQDVAQELGTKPSSLYRHVKNKRELYFAMVTREFNGFNEKIGEFIRSGAEPRETMRFVGELILSIARKDFGLFKLMFLSKPPPGSGNNWSAGPFEQACNPMTIKNMIGLVKSLNQGGDTVYLTYTLMSVVIGGAILTSEIYEQLNEGILDSEKYHEFHTYLLDQLQSIFS